MLCLNCIDKMDTWHSYKMSCCENQAKLQGWLDEVDPQDDVKINLSYHSIKISNINYHSQKSASNDRYTPGLEHLRTELEYDVQDDVSCIHFKCPFQIILTNFLLGYTHQK